MKEIWLDWKLEELNKREKGAISWLKYVLTMQGIEVFDCGNNEFIPCKVIQLWNEKFGGENENSKTA